MFANVLIANRGEIACRIIRTARRMGMRTIAVATPADRARGSRASPTRRSRSARARRAISTAAIVALAKRVRRAMPSSRLRLPKRERRFRRGLREAGVVFVGPPPEAMRAMGLKSSAKALMAGRRADRARLSRRQPEPEVPQGKGLRDRLSRAHQGDRRRRRARHAPGRRACRFRRRARQRDPRGGGRVRRRTRADREIYRRAAPHRSAGVRRRAWRLRPPLRARLFVAAPASEGDRGVPGAGPARGDARRDGESRGRGGAGGGLCRRRHGRVHRRSSRGLKTRRLLFPGDEHPASGRASGHRSDHRPRSGRMAIPGRGRRAAAAEQSEIACAGAAIEARLYAEDPEHGFLPSPG